MLAARLSFTRLLAALAILAGRGEARADARAAEAELRVDWRVTAAMIAGSGAAFLLSDRVLVKELAADQCRWCETNGLDTFMRGSLKWDDASQAGSLSNLTGFVLAPISAFGLLGLAAVHDGRGGNWFVDSAIVLETALVACNMTQMVKLSAGRERPDVHDMAAGTRPVSLENNLSFYSGHANLAFTLAVSSGTIASWRGYRLAPLVWASGMSIATATAYLRIAADRHYFSDVLGGALFGTAVGVGLPMLLHRHGGLRDTHLIPNVVPLPGGAYAGLTLTW